jgi:hypothetical protein
MKMATRIQLKRGAGANLPTSGMLAGEPLVTTDKKNLFVASDATTKFTPTPDVSVLSSLASIDGSADLIMVHDASESTGQREKKVTFAEFKNALNIPSSSTDEKVAAVAGATADYLFGTDATDGVIRGSSSISVTLDSTNDFARLVVEVVDGGTFT